MSNHDRGIHETEVMDEGDDAEMTRVEWEPPNSAATGPRENAILALQAAAIAAQQFNTHFSTQDDDREASIPLFWGDEMVLGREPLRNWGYFVEYELKAVRLLQEAEEDSDQEHERARSHVMEKSIDGNYSVKLMQPGLMDLDCGIWASEDFMTETRLLMNLPPHRNVSQIYGLNKGGIDTLLESGRRGFFIITDRVQETLSERLSAWKAKKGYRNPSIPGQTIRRFAQRIEVALDIAAALKFLHERKLVYHVRPDKIGFDVNGDVKLFQFGQVRQEGSGQAQARSLTNSEDMNVLRYIAPEVLCKAPATTGSDVYSFGIVLWEIMSLKTPYGGWDRATHLERCVQHHGRPPMNRQWPAACHELLQSTWDPHLRLTMRKVLAKLSDLLMIEESSSGRQNSRNSGRQNSRNSGKASRHGNSGHRREEVSGHQRRESSGHHQEGSQRKSRATVVAAPNVLEEVPSATKEEPDNKMTAMKNGHAAVDIPASAKHPMTRLENHSASSPTVVPLPPLSPEGEARLVLDPVVVSLPRLSPSKNEDEEEQASKRDATIAEDVTVDNVVKASASPICNRRQRSPSPSRQRVNSPHRNRSDVPQKRMQRRASVDLTSRQGNNKPTKSLTSPMPKPGRIHRSASMSHVGKNPGVVVLQPTPLDDNRVPANDDYDDDFEHGEDEDRGKNFYGYDKSPLKSKSTLALDDCDKSARSSRSVGQSPLRRRLGDAASALIGGIASQLRRPSSTGNSRVSPDAPEKGLDGSMSSLTSSPQRTSNDSIPDVRTPNREPKESVISVLSTPQRDPKTSVSADTTASQELKDSMSVESTPRRREHRKKATGQKDRKNQESTSGQTLDRQESSHSPRNPHIESTSASSRRSESSTTPGAEKQKPDPTPSVTWRRHRSVRCSGTASPRKASMGWVKNSRIFSSNTNSNRAESIKEELTITILNDDESGHLDSPHKVKTSGENSNDEKNAITDDGTTSESRLGRHNSGANENNMRRRRAAQGQAIQRRSTNDQEASTNLPEVPPTPAARVRQRRRGSTGGAVPMIGCPGESQTSAFLEDLRRRAKLGNQSGDGKSAYNQESETSGHRRSLHERSGHSRLASNEGRMHDIVKPINESSPDLSTSTAATTCSSTIDSSRIDRLINLEEENTKEEVPLDPVTPRRRMARLTVSSVTHLFRKGGNGDGRVTQAAQEVIPSTPKLMSRFMNNDTGGKEYVTNDENKSKVVPGLSRKNRRASVG